MHKLTVTVITFLLCIVLLPKILAAQEALVGDPVAEACATATTKSMTSNACKVLFNANSPTGDAKGAALDDSSSIVVAVDDDTQTATIQFVVPWQRSKLAFTVASPVNKDSGQAAFVGFDGLGDTQKAKLEYSYIKWPRFSLYAMFDESKKGDFPGGDWLDLLSKGQTLVCQGQAKWLKEKKANLVSRGAWSVELNSLFELVNKVDLPTQGEITTFWETSKTGGSSVEPDTEEFRSLAKKVRSIIQDLEKEDGYCAKLRKARLFDPSGEVIKLGLEEFIHRSVLAMGVQRAYFFNTNATVGRKDFSFIGREDAQAGVITKQSSTEVPWSIGVRTGFIFLTHELETDPAAALTFSANLERSFKATDSVDVCKPVLGDLSSCESISLGDPEMVDSYLLSVEYRGKLARMAYAIRAFYRGIDSKPDDFGVEVPLYFLRNSTGGFQGGISFGWRDQDDNGTIAVFVGKSFDIYN